MYQNYSPENWAQVEEFIKANFPNVPVYRVKNIIQATNGRQAWGMLHDGYIYVMRKKQVQLTMKCLKQCGKCLQVPLINKQL
jgi:hypothetical protein